MSAQGGLLALNLIWGFTLSLIQPILSPAIAHRVMLLCMYIRWFHSLLVQGGYIVPELSLEPYLMPPSFTLLQCHWLPRVGYLRIISRDKNSWESHLLESVPGKASRRVTEGTEKEESQARVRNQAKSQLAQLWPTFAGEVWEVPPLGQGSWGIDTPVFISIGKGLPQRIPFPELVALGTCRQSEFWQPEGSFPIERHLLLLGGKANQRLMNLNRYRQSGDSTCDTGSLFLKHSLKASWDLIKVCPTLDLSAPGPLHRCLLYLKRVLASFLPPSVSYKWRWSCTCLKEALQCPVLSFSALITVSHGLLVSYLSPQ